MSNSYDFTVSYDSLPVGSHYQLAEQKKVWTNPAVTGWRNRDIDAKRIYSIVAGGPKGEHCVNQFYPVGSYGTSYHVAGYGDGDWGNTVKPCNIINASVWLKFCKGYDLAGTQGKIFRLVWGNLETRLMWQYKTMNSGPVHLRCYSAKMDNGAQCPNIQTPWDVVEDVWYLVHFRMVPGAAGGQQISIKKPTDAAEVMYLNNRTMTDQYNSSQSPIIDDNSFFGGGGIQQA